MNLLQFLPPLALALSTAWNVFNALTSKTMSAEWWASTAFGFCCFIFSCALLLKEPKP